MKKHRMERAQSFAFEGQSGPDFTADCFLDVNQFSSFSIISLGDSAHFDCVNRPEVVTSKESPPG